MNRATLQQWDNAIEPSLRQLITQFRAAELWTAATDGDEHKIREQLKAFVMAKEGLTQVEAAALGRALA